MLESILHRINQGNLRHKTGEYQSVIRLICEKIGYEVMQSLKTHGAPADDSVYQFILKKEP